MFPRGFVPPALVTSALALIGCSIGWGALGVVSFTEPDSLSVAAHRYVCILLATVTLGAAMVNLSARIVRTIRVAHDMDDEGAGGGYADGYAAGLLARPEATRHEVTRLVPARR